LGKKYYGPEIDIWSLGVILYVLVSASLPFDSDNLQHIKQKVLTCKFRIPYFMSQDCEDLINNILILNASNRFKMQQIKSHRWIKINNSSYYYSVNNNNNNNNNCDSETVQITSNYDRVKSKSLKLVGNRKKSLLKHNSAISTLSLPLYSYNEDTSTIKPVQIHSDYSKQKSDSISSNIIINNNNNNNNSNLNNNNNNVAIKPINKPFCFFNNYTRRLSELISNSSSVDEGVESDWSSSLSSDVMSLTSSNSIQSFYLQSPSSIPKSKHINPPPPPTTTPTTTTTSKSSITNKKSSLLSSAFHFNRRQKFQLMKNNKTTTTDNDSFDLKLIKLELETLKTKCFNENEKFKNFKPNNIENNKLIKDYSQEQTNAAYKAETLQKFKQFIFHNNSNKKNIFDYFDTTSPTALNNNNNNNISKTNKKCILKQKSSSLISINNENIDDQESKLHDFNFNNKNNTKSIRVHEFKFNSIRKYSMNKLV
jgi:hypothetical protein